MPWTPYRVGLCLEALVPSWQGPCTHKTGSWCHHLVEDVEDPADHVENLGDGPEDLAEVGEALMTHFVVIHALMVSWYPRRRPSYPTSDITMDLGPWMLPSVVDEVLGPTLSGLMTLQPLLGSWGSCMMMMTLYGLWHAMEPMNMPNIHWHHFGIHISLYTKHPW